MIKIKCEICGKMYYQISESHLQKHNTTSKEYREKYPDAPMRSEEFKKSISENKERSRKITESLTGKPSGMLGKHHTPETKLKIGDAERGDKNHMFGKHRSEATKRKISKANSNPSEETRKKMSNAQKGRTKEEYEYIQRKSDLITGRTKENYDYLKKSSEKRKILCKNPTPAMIKGYKKQGDKLRGRKRPFMIGDKNPMKREEVLQKALKSLKVKPNKMEKELNNIIQYILPNEYKTNVKANVLTLSGKIPDFVNVNGKKKLIEFNGDYWHTEEETEKRVELFKSLGWETLIIWEHELKDKNLVINKILNFHGLKSKLGTKQLTID